jgi:hypothetical protein
MFLRLVVASTCSFFIALIPLSLSLADSPCYSGTWRGVEITLNDGTEYSGIHYWVNYDGRPFSEYLSLQTNKILVYTEPITHPILRRGYFLASARLKVEVSTILQLRATDEKFSFGHCASGIVLTPKFLELLKGEPLARVQIERPS